MTDGTGVGICDVGLEATTTMTGEGSVKEGSG